MWMIQRITELNRTAYSCRWISHWRREPNAKQVIFVSVGSGQYRLNLAIAMRDGADLLLQVNTPELFVQPNIASYGHQARCHRFCAFFDSDMQRLPDAQFECIQNETVIQCYTLSVISFWFCSFGIQFKLVSLFKVSKLAAEAHFIFDVLIHSIRSWNIDENRVESI